MTASPARPGAGTVVGAACWTLTVARIEDRIRAAKATGLANLPFDA
jgi:hypothetical protein